MITDNELIAEFMGFRKTGTFYETNGVRHDKYVSDAYGCTYPAEWAFDRKWDWLMPVVEKIGKLYEANFPKGDEFMRRILAHEDPIEKEYIDVISTSICTPINEVFDEVIKFIKWYNDNKTLHE